MMQWKQLLNTERYGDTEQYRKIPDGRNIFERDQDKILFSCSFRRLTHKTQVHPLPENDHIHNRLSHSLEVASVGRTLGYKVGGYLKKKGLLKGIKVTQQDIGHIVEAACLAHDIGNPPFGHSGESAIREWFSAGNGKTLLDNISQEHTVAQWFLELSKQELHPSILDLSKDILNESQNRDFKCFEGNAQGFRIITQIEYFLFKGGMRLTYATLGTFLKYPWTSDTYLSKEKQKYGCNQSEFLILQDIARHTGLEEELSSHNQCCYFRHPLSYLMEAADDICYKIIDLEDGLEMGLISFAEFEKITRINILKKRVPEEYRSIPISASNRRKLAVVRSAIVNHWIDKIYKIFVSNLDLIMSGKFKQTLTEALAKEDKSFELFIDKCNDITRDKIFNHSKKIEMEIASYPVIFTLLDAFIPTICKTYFCKIKIANDLEKDPSFSKLDDKSKKKRIKKEMKKYISFKEIRILDLIGSNMPDMDRSLYDHMMVVMIILRE
jgi:dGTPase